MSLRPYFLASLLGSAVMLYGQASSDPISHIESLLRANQYSQAVQLIQSELRAAPHDARLWALEGIAFSLENHPAEALKAFDRTLQLEPENMAALRGEAQILYQERSARVIPVLRRIVRLAPEDATAHEMLGDAEKNASDCGAAIHDFEQSGSSYRSHPESLEAYGACLYQRGETQQAIDLFQSFVQRFPQLSYARYDLALILYKDRHYVEAEKAIEPLIAANASDPDLLSLASDIYEAAGDTPRAVALLRQAIVLEPGNANLYNTFALLCLDHDSYQVGIDMINIGLQRIHGDPSLYLSRGLLYVQLYRFDKAEADFEKAEHLNPRLSLVSYAMDVAVLQKYNFDSKHSDQAVRELRAQIRLHPHSAMLEYLLAKLLTTQSSDGSKGSLIEARSAAQTAVRLNPHFIAARDTLTIIDLRSGNYQEAEEQCRAILRDDPLDRSATYNLIRALKHSNKPQDQAEAQELVKKLAQMESASRQQETARKKFHLVEAPAPANTQAGPSSSSEGK